ncbi:MAG: hypothetical protein AAF494_14655, partial [Pseudomonadota bacterium]
MKFGPRFFACGISIFGLLLLSIALPVKAEPAPITGIVQGPIAEPQPIAPSIADPATEILDL